MRLTLSEEHAVLADVLPHLRCPVCRAPLAPATVALRCPAGHSFDLARQGYVDLARGPLRHPGDPARSVAARHSFLATGAFDFIPAALAAGCGERRGLVVDVGAGTGHHLARVLGALPGTVGLALDASKPALRRAARAHRSIGAVRADIWQQLPVADRSAAAVLVVFAPRNPAEFSRILAPDGLLLVVAPTTEHLGDLAARLGAADGVRLLRVDPEKPAQVTAGLAPHFQQMDSQVHTRSLALRRTNVHDLISMGPSGVHTDPQALRRVVETLPEPVPVTASIRLTTYAHAPLPVDLGETPPEMP